MDEDQLRAMGCPERAIAFLITGELEDKPEEDPLHVEMPPHLRERVMEDARRIFCL